VEPTAEPAGLTFEKRLEQKFVCTSAEAGGYALDTAMLGGEFSIVFHGDNTAEFVMANSPVTGLIVLLVVVLVGTVVVMRASRSV
jgi:uncharacterized membrane-anchored protein